MRLIYCAWCLPRRNPAFTIMEGAAMCETHWHMKSKAVVPGGDEDPHGAALTPPNIPAEFPNPANVPDDIRDLVAPGRWDS